MVTTILPHTGEPSKTPTFDGLDGPELPVEPAHHEGLVLIILGLSGFHSVQILADESATQEILLNLFQSVRPALEEAVGTRNAEPVGIGN